MLFGPVDGEDAVSDLPSLKNRFRCDGGDIDWHVITLFLVREFKTALQRIDFALVFELLTREQHVDDFCIFTQSSERVFELHPMEMFDHAVT